MYIMLLILNLLYYLGVILKSWLLIVYFMGLVIYFVLTLFCGYMAFELGRYVIATGDALPIIIVVYWLYYQYIVLSKYIRQSRTKTSIS